MSQETRSILAAVLALLGIGGGSLIYKAPQPTPPAKPPAPITNPIQPASGTPSTPNVGKSAGTAPPAAPATVRAATDERSVVIESDVYRVQISNRGGVVRSWQLTHFTDDNKPPRTLDLAHAEAAQQSGSWPLSLALDDPQAETAANTGLYEITSAGKPLDAGAVLHAPAEITLAWSDGHIEVTKHLKFNPFYIVDVQTTVTQDGNPRRASLAWAGGFGDATAFRAAAQTQVFGSAAGRLTTLVAKNLGKPGQTSIRAAVAGTFDFVGIQDQFFAAAFMPPFNARGDLAEVPFTLTGWVFQRQITTDDGKTETDIVP